TSSCYREGWIADASATDFFCVALWRNLLAMPCCCADCSCCRCFMSAKSPSPKIPLPLGTVLGYAPGNVAAYSSDYKSADPQQLPGRHSYRHYENGIYTGYKWQCVEF